LRARNERVLRRRQPKPPGARRHTRQTEYVDSSQKPPIAAAFLVSDQWCAQARTVSDAQTKQSRGTSRCNTKTSHTCCCLLMAPTRPSLRTRSNTQPGTTAKDGE